MPVSMQAKAHIKGKDTTVVTDCFYLICSAPTRVPVLTGPGGSSRQGRRESLAPPVGLGLYEDTDFITRPVGDSRSSMAASGAAAGSGLSLYEDTEFITQRVSSSTAGDAGPAAPEQHEHGLGLYEDTEFITRPVPRPPAATSAGSSNTLLLSKLNRLSLANEALYRGQGGTRVSGLRVSRGSDENALPSTAGAAAIAAAGGGSSSLGLYEDTEFLGDAGGQGSSSSDSGGTVGGAAFGASVADGEPAAVTDENAPAGSVSGCPQQQQQQEQLEATAQGRGAAAAAGAVLASVGSSGSSSSILQQQHPHGYGGAGPSRFGPGSVPNSPGKWGCGFDHVMSLRRPAVAFAAALSWLCPASDGQ